MSSVTADVRGGVALRAWALAVLAGRQGVVCPDVSATAWDLFLEGERCGLPLLRMLERESGLSAMPQEWVGRLQRRAEAEAGRIQSARRHLSALAAIGRRLGWPVVVFKGAATALNAAEALDMEDVDVLVGPDHVPALVDELTRVGYADRGVGASARHIAGLGNDDLLKIDVHFSVDIAGGELDRGVWSRIRPYRDQRGLWTLAPSDHVWLMLTHIVVEHPNRSSNIRELLLLQSQLRGVPEVLRDVERLIEPRPHRDALRAVLHEAVALVRGDPPSPEFDRRAAMVLTVRRLLRPWTLPTVVMQWSYQTSFALVLGRTARRGFWRRVLAPKGRSQYRWLAELEDRYPVPGMAIRLAGRFSAVLLSLVMAVPVSARAILIRRRAMRHS